MDSKRKIPIGQNDFKRIIEENYYYIDKSLIIKEVIDDGSNTILISRPGKFGKTLNMSMLKYFFEKTINDTSYLFKDLKINTHKKHMSYQGNHPVICISFNDIKEISFDMCLEKIKKLIAREYRRHDYLLNSKSLNINECKLYNKMLDISASFVDFEDSLKGLCTYLHDYYKKKVIILIDEYDIPINSGYSNGYYKEIILLMGNLLSSVLKDNENLEKALLTGTFTIAKEGIFSGLDNINVSTILSSQYSDKYGFLEEEVLEMIKYYEIESKASDIKNWYNGYVFGKIIVYNPWTIANFISKWEEGLLPYWINTSGNCIITKLIEKGDQTLMEELEILIRDGQIEKEINEYIVLSDIDKDTDSIWNYLLFSGYLKAIPSRVNEGIKYCKLMIPNKEVKYLYKKIILSWFDYNIKIYKYKKMVTALISGNIEEFEDIFCEYIESVFSYHNTAEKEPDIVYQAFILGILVSLSDAYEIKLNRENDIKRYNVAMIPEDKNKIGIIFEFKKANPKKKESLEIALSTSIQIEQMNYRKEIQDRGINSIIGIAIAFAGKDALISYKYL